MTKKMLIDASHPEETRVAILDGNRLEAFDFESANKKQLKGNVYLARVTRVEPSLQACFVEYGGNRQGFLAFSEIHPDYYQIPIADREALMAEDADHEPEAEEQADEPVDSEAANSPESESESEEASANDESTEGGNEGEETTSTESEAEAPNTQSKSNGGGIETVGGDEAEEERQFRKLKFYRKYKIQEVIKRRQVLLIQVVKEERGMKGAALTTYISLPGRYCVLMPNSARSGVSRKISNFQDRRRMKSLISSLEVPDGMAVILRTAGADRPKTDIKRDCDYLLKVWDEIRDKTLVSNAPALIYEEGNLVKRAVRDLYSRDLELILIEGEEGYKTAKALMKVLTPSHAKRVQQFKDKDTNLFQKYQVESQIDSVHDNRVELPAGGYIIINQTEALVAVDVNSGRSTRERNIEETAVRTNLEAAEEIARQMRLRDLAGLIVIDFIDMENHRNKIEVERRFKEFVRKDRARMQIGRISHFGLLELTRQRLRPSVLEGSSSKCPTCNGMGVVRSTESSALAILRAIEEDLGRRQSKELKIFLQDHAAMYLLNHKRSAFAELEQKHGCKIILQFDNTLVPPAFRLERTKADGAIEEESSEENKAEQRPHPRSRHQHHHGDRKQRHRNEFHEGRNNDRNDRNNGHDRNDSVDSASDEAAPEDIATEGNITQVEGENSGEEGGRNNRRDRFGKRGRGRDRFRNRNRNRNRQRGQNPQNDGRGQHTTAEATESGSAPSFDPEPADYINSDMAASEARHESPNFEDAPRYERVESFTPTVSSVPDRNQERVETIPDNVEVITDAPSNPKRGWWRRSS